jgi:hypothetical protein
MQITQQANTCRLHNFGLCPKLHLSNTRYGGAFVNLTSAGDGDLAVGRGQSSPESQNHDLAVRVRLHYADPHDSRDCLIEYGASYAWPSENSLIVVR